MKLARKMFLSLMLLLLVVTSLGAIPAKAQPANVPTARYHHVTFYLTSALAATSPTGITEKLQQYVADVNTFLAKTTDRQWIYDGWEISEVNPISGSWSSPQPEGNYAIKIFAQKSAMNHSYGGFMTGDETGAGGIAGTYWEKIYGTSDATLDYVTQIYILTHEFAHIAGAGFGEYYSFVSKSDTTGITPLNNIDWYNSNDQFWSDKRNFGPDPLLFPPQGTTIASQLAYMTYSPLTSAIINGDNRNQPLATINSVHVHFTVDGVETSPRWRVYKYSMATCASNPTLTLISDTTSLGYNYTWDYSQGKNVCSMLILVKATYAGRTSSKWISSFDSDIAKFVNNQTQYTTTILGVPVVIDD